MFQALGHEPMAAGCAVPEAAPAALGARLAEERVLGLGDLHRKILCGAGAGRLVPAVSAASAGNSSSRPSVVWSWCRSASPAGSSRVLLIGQALGVLDVAGRLPDQDSVSTRGLQVVEIAPGSRRRGLSVLPGTWGAQGVFRPGIPRPRAGRMGSGPGSGPQASTASSSPARVARRGRGLQGVKQFRLG